MLFVRFIIYQQIEGEFVFNKYSCSTWLRMFSIGHWRRIKESTVTWHCCSRSVRPSRAQRQASRSSLPSSVVSLTGKRLNHDICYFTSCRLVVSTRWRAVFLLYTQNDFGGSCELQNSIVLFNLEVVSLFSFPLKSYLPD